MWNNFYFGILIFLFSCGLDLNKGPLIQRLQTSPVENTELSFQLVNEKIFIPKCLLCHGNAGGINLESFEQVKQNITKIELTTLVTKSMPKNASLTNSEMQILSAWIKAGIPEGKPPEVKPTEIPDPLEAKFSSIKRNIFEKKCLSCHSNGGTGHDVPLDSIAAMVNSPRQIVIPENPDESGLVLAIEREDGKRMPPPEVGNPLSPIEISIIRKWIEDSLPE